MDEGHPLQTLDLLELIITEEFRTRKQNTMRRHLKQAKLSDPSAHLNELDSAPDRQLNPQVIEQLSTNHLSKCDHPRGNQHREKLRCQ